MKTKIVMSNSSNLLTALIAPLFNACFSKKLNWVTFKHTSFDMSRKNHIFILLYHFQRNWEQQCYIAITYITMCAELIPFFLLNVKRSMYKGLIASSHDGEIAVVRSCEVSSANMYWLAVTFMLGFKLYWFPQSLSLSMFGGISLVWTPTHRN